jgi:hypothetical protein
MGFANNLDIEREPRQRDSEHPVVVPWAPEKIKLPVLEMESLREGHFAMYQQLLVWEM